MIRSTNHSSFSKVGDAALDQILRTTRARQERGKASAEDVRAAVDEVIGVVVAQQGRAFIDIVTDGMVGWDGPLSHLAQNVDGLRTAEMVRWFDTNFYDPRVEIHGPIRHRDPFTVRDFEVAQDIASKHVVKSVLPGAVSFARSARDQHYGSLEAVADAMALALGAEVKALAAAGCSCFQLDEPLLCRHPEDLDLVARSARVVFEAAGENATTILSTYFGDLSTLSERLDELPGTHLGLEATPGSPNFALLDRLPEGKGVMLGVFDARTSVQEDAADVAALLEPHRESLTRRDVLVGPNAGLEPLTRDHAFDKLLHARYLVEKLAKDWTWAS